MCETHSKDEQELMCLLERGKERVCVYGRYGG